MEHRLRQLMADPVNEDRLIAMAAKEGLAAFSTIAARNLV
jgi:hypothetical protein